MTGDGSCAAPAKASTPAVRVPASAFNAKLLDAMREIAFCTISRCAIFAGSNSVIVPASQAIIVQMGPASDARHGTR